MGTHLKLALRNLYREKLYALINIAGLSIAIACCIVLALYLRGELTYDHSNVNYKKIYRVVNEFTTNGTAQSFAVTSPVLGPMLKEAYPEVKDYVRFRPVLSSGPGENEVVYRHGDQSYYWDDVYFADPNVFKVFTFKILYGNPATALTQPNTIAVSETFARRYFGNKNPVGETMMSSNNIPLRITLVFADQPPNTHLKYDVLGSMSNFHTPDNTTMRRRSLWGVGIYTYLVMPANYNPDDFATISKDFFAKNMAAQGRALNSTWRAWVQPLASIHYHSTVNYDLPRGNIFYLYGFAAVGLFILAVASINYINLATARATKRARGVGIRKILGAERRSLIAQFLSEATVFTVIAAVFGVVIVEIVLTLAPVQMLFGKPLVFNLMHEPGVTAAILLGSICLGLLSGVYPALYLSSWAPLTALVGRFTGGKGSIRFRQILVFAQFAISIAVIASTLLMAAQMRFVANKKLGFQKQNRIMVTLRGVKLIEQEPTLKTELKKNAHILGVTTSSAMMGQTMPVNLFKVEANDGSMQTQGFSHMAVGDDFIEVMGMHLVDGRDFSKKLLTDVGTTFVVNQAFVRKMGWTEPLGKRIGDGRVIGVVQDFNFKSLHSVIEPFAMTPIQNNFDNVSAAVRPFLQRLLVLDVAGSDLPATLKFVQDKMAQFDPSHPFEFEFVDDSLNKLYASERQLMALIAIFAGICIFVACLGLFGLAAFTTEQRTKEIGIRKVLGSSSLQIVFLLAKGILALVLVGAVVASIGAYFAMDQWLAGFAYRAPIDPLVFVVATAAALLVAFLTIALQSYKAASADPVDALRYE